MLKGVVLGFVVVVVVGGLYLARESMRPTDPVATPPAEHADSGVDAGPEIDLVMGTAHVLHFGRGDVLERCDETTFSTIGIVGSEAFDIAQDALFRAALERMGDGARRGGCPLNVRPSLAICRVATQTGHFDVAPSPRVDIDDQTRLFSFREVFESQSAFRACTDAGHEWISVERDSVEALQAQADELTRRFR